MAAQLASARSSALHTSLVQRHEALDSRLGLSVSNSTLCSARSPGIARVLQRLLRGQQVRVYIVGGSAAAGAGGAGYNGTFDAQLVKRLNSLLASVERSNERPLGRLVRMNVAQGGTTSFWAGLFSEALHARRAHLLIWEYAINDHAVSLEIAGRGAVSRRHALVTSSSCGPRLC